MGCSLSRRPHCSTFQGVRVVHINGYVEDYAGPVAVSEVTGKPPRLVCFSPAQLLSFPPRPLPLDGTLEPGRLYFLLPHSVLRSDTSTVDLATLVTRLTALARNAAAKPKLSDGAVKVMASPRHGDAALAGREPEAAGSLAAGIPSRARSWKPMLGTIEEWSVGRSTRSLSSRSGSSRRQPPRG